MHLEVTNLYNITITEWLICARHCSKLFTWIVNLMPIISIEVKEVSSVISCVVQVRRCKHRKVKKSPTVTQMSVKGGPIPEHTSELLLSLPLRVLQPQERRLCDVYLPPQRHIAIPLTFAKFPLEQRRDTHLKSYYPLLLFKIFAGTSLSTLL